MGEQVAARKSDFGLLVCSTGIGISISANKVPGARAALVFDEHMAALWPPAQQRQRPLPGAGTTPPELAKKILDVFLAASFEGGRHERRVNKMEHYQPPPLDSA